MKNSGTFGAALMGALRGLGILSGKYSQWGSVLIQANQKRVIPVHSHQSITRLNTSWTNEIEEVNQHRARQQNLKKMILTF